VAKKQITLADFENLDFEVANETSVELDVFFEGNVITIREVNPNRYHQRKSAAKARRKELVAKAVNK
jgi:hypothetical protein